MRRRAGAALLLLASALSWAAPGAAPKRGRIVGLRVRGDEATAVVEVQGDRPLSFTTLRLAAPPRVVLDFTDAEIQGVPREQEIEDGTIRRIGVAAVGARTARVVIELTGEADFDVRALGARLDIRVPRVSPLLARAAPHAPVKAPATPGESASAAAPGAAAPIAAPAVAAAAPAVADPPAAAAVSTAAEPTAPPSALAALTRTEPTRPAAMPPGPPAPGAREAPARDAAREVATREVAARESAASETAAREVAARAAAARELEARETAARETAAREAAARETAAREPVSGGPAPAVDARAAAAAGEVSPPTAPPPTKPAEPADPAAATAAAAAAEVDPRRSLPTVSLAGSTQHPRLPPVDTAVPAPAPLLAARSAPPSEPGAPWSPAHGAPATERAQGRAESGVAIASASAARPAPAPPAAHATHPHHVAREPSGTHTSITGIGFRPGAGGAVIVRSDRPLDYGVSEDERAVLLHLRGAEIKRPNDRLPLDTRFFGGVVERVIPLVVAGGIDLRIELHAHADYQLQEGDGVLSLTFTTPR